MDIGASFSQRHLRDQGLDPLKALKEFKGLGLKWIRLGCYWDEIEKNQSKFSFSQLDPLIDYCGKENINVVLTVGMKAPRYPEYYIPDWLREKLNLHRLSTITADNEILLDATLKYLTEIVWHFKNSSAIKVWQVENEPFDVSGENWWKISSGFLHNETDLVRKLDPKRKILVNVWGNELSKRKIYKKAIQLADIIGFDIYLRHPIFLFFNFFNRYIGPIDSKNTITRIIGEIRAEGKEVWLAELQMEPWEVGELMTKMDNPPSFLPKHFCGNLEYGKALGPSMLFLWGFEWWYYRKGIGDSRYWEEAKKAVGAKGLY